MTAPHPYRVPERVWRRAHERECVDACIFVPEIVCENDRSTCRGEEEDIQPAVTGYQGPRKDEIGDRGVSLCHAGYTANGEW